MDNLDFAARFFLMPNKLKYKKMRLADHELFDFCCGSSKDIAPLLKKYSGINLYLDLIAKKHNKKAYDLDVLEAYWLGNELLDGITAEDFKQHLDRKMRDGKIDPETAEQLLNSIPKNMVPHHSFHILHILSVAKDKSLMYANVDKCSIGYGEVVEVKESTLRCRKNGSERVINVNHLFLKDIRVGDMVAIHWDFAIQKITKQQAHNLDRYTTASSNALPAVKAQAVAGHTH